MARLVARRAFMAGAAALAAAPNAWAQAQPTRFSALRVNAEPLAGRGAGAAAAAIERIMPEKLRIVFADLVSPGSKALPALVARIDTLSLTGLADTRPGTLYSMQQDTMSGAGLVVAGQTVLSVTPLHVNLPPGFSGTWYLPDIDVRRIDSLCYQFAYWLRREMQL
jgi:hypothetical protein